MFGANGLWHFVLLVINHLFAPLHPGQALLLCTQPEFASQLTERVSALSSGVSPMLHAWQDPDDEKASLPTLAVRAASSPCSASVRTGRDPAQGTRLGSHLLPGNG